MKTDKLIDVLSANVEPIKGGELRHALAVGLGVGGAIALCLMFAIFGLPADAFRSEYVGLKGLALALTLGVAAVGAGFLVRLARPGQPARLPLLPIVLALFLLIAASCVTLALTAPAAWSRLVLGPQWSVCLVCVPLFAVAPFASLIWALRKGAPTNLRRTGAVAGLVAGALGAAVFALHHVGGSIPFITLWYGGPILLCTLFGALLGPRLLRW